MGSFYIHDGELGYIYIYIWGPFTFMMVNWGISIDGVGLGF